MPDALVQRYRFAEVRTTLMLVRPANVAGSCRNVGPAAPTLSVAFATCVMQDWALHSSIQSTLKAS